MKLPFLAAAAAVVAAVSGCATYQPIETTPEGIVGQVEPGARVRVVTRDERELRLLVMGIDDASIRGRLDDGAGGPIEVSFDEIREIELHGFSMRRTLLGVVLPVVAGAVIACNNDDCRSTASVDADL